MNIQDNIELYSIGELVELPFGEIGIITHINNEKTPSIIEYVCKIIYATVSDIHSYGEYPHNVVNPVNIRLSSTNNLYKEAKNIVSCYENSKHAILYDSLPIDISIRLEKQSIHSLNFAIKDAKLSKSKLSEYRIPLWENRLEVHRDNLKRLLKIKYHS